MTKNIPGLAPRNNSRFGFNQSKFVDGGLVEMPVQGKSGSSEIGGKDELFWFSTSGDVDKHKSRPGRPKESGPKKAGQRKPPHKNSRIEKLAYQNLRK